MNDQIHLEKLQSILKDLENDSPDIISIIKAIQNHLQLLEAAQAQQPDLPESLDDPKYDFLEGSLLEATVHQYILNKPKDMHLLEFVRFQPFITLFMRLVNECVFCDPLRRPIFKEIFALYKHQYFAGCICLLYGQIEGLITDFLLYERKIYRRRKGLFIKQPNRRPRKIVGLKLKIDIAKRDPKTEWITKLGAYSEFKTIDGNKRLTLSRNLVLHGDELDNLNQEHAFILITWCYYLFSQADQIYTHTGVKA
ncbi:MAG: hypothetical protein KBC57_05125 [Neisseriaceae bacterium]|nr:hypothetical protein [Neisseriaceae bacterium]